MLQGAKAARQVAGRCTCEMGCDEGDAGVKHGHAARHAALVARGVHDATWYSCSAQHTAQGCDGVAGYDAEDYANQLLRADAREEVGANGLARAYITTGFRL